VPILNILYSNTLTRLFHCGSIPIYIAVHDVLCSCVLNNFCIFRLQIALLGIPIIIGRSSEGVMVFLYCYPQTRAQIIGQLY